MEINLGALAFDIDFHPSQPLVTTGLINGDLHLYRYASDSAPERVLEVHAHGESSCRAARFINNGQAIVTGSPDCSILATDVETGAAIAHLKEAHGSAVNKIINLTESTVASGDDEGCIKVWDTRQQSCCNSFNAHEEYISDMTFAADSMKLLGTSGDGTLSVCNLRRNKVHAQSEFSEEELLSVVIMKLTDWESIIVFLGLFQGLQSKHIHSYMQDTLNLMGYPIQSNLAHQSWPDRFVDLSPNSVDVLLKLDEDRLITGSETGLISLVGILPNQVIQPIAEHSEYPVEGLAFSHDKKFMGSIAHDQMLKLWNMDELLQGSTSAVNHRAAVEDSDSDEMDTDFRTPKSKKGTKKRNASSARVPGSSNNFFDDLEMEG